MCGCSGSRNKAWKNKARISAPARIAAPTAPKITTNLTPMGMAELPSPDPAKQEIQRLRREAKLKALGRI